MPETPEQKLYDVWMNDPELSSDPELKAQANLWIKQGKVKPRTSKTAQNPEQPIMMMPSPGLKASSPMSRDTPYVVEMPSPKALSLQPGFEAGMGEGYLKTTPVAKKGWGEARRDGQVIPRMPIVAVNQDGSIRPIPYVDASVSPILDMIYENPDAEIPFTLDDEKGGRATITFRRPKPEEERAIRTASKERLTKAYADDTDVDPFNQLTPTDLAFMGAGEGLASNLSGSLISNLGGLAMSRLGPVGMGIGRIAGGLAGGVLGGAAENEYEKYSNPGSYVAEMADRATTAGRPPFERGAYAFGNAITGGLTDVPSTAAINAMARSQGLVTPIADTIGKQAISRGTNAVAAGAITAGAEVANKGWEVLADPSQLDLPTIAANVAAGALNPVQLGTFRPPNPGELELPQGSFQIKEKGENLVYDIVGHTPDGFSRVKIYNTKTPTKVVEVRKPTTGLIKTLGGKDVVKIAEPPPPTPVDAFGEPVRPPASPEPNTVAATAVSPRLPQGPPVPAAKSVFDVPSPKPTPFNPHPGVFSGVEPRPFNLAEDVGGIPTPNRRVPLPPPTEVVEAGLTPVGMESPTLPEPTPVRADEPMLPEEAMDAPLQSMVPPNASVPQTGFTRVLGPGGIPGVTRVDAYFGGVPIGELEVPTQYFKGKTVQQAVDAYVGAMTGATPAEAPAIPPRVPSEQAVPTIAPDRAPRRLMRTPFNPDAPPAPGVGGRRGEILRELAQADAKLAELSKTSNPTGPDGTYILAVQSTRNDLLSELKELDAPMRAPGTNIYAALPGGPPLDPQFYKEAASFTRNIVMNLASKAKGGIDRAKVQRFLKENYGDFAAATYTDDILARVKAYRQDPRSIVNIPNGVKLLDASGAPLPLLKVPKAVQEATGRKFSSDYEQGLYDDFAANQGSILDKLREDLPQAAKTSSQQKTSYSHERRNRLGQALSQEDAAQSRAAITGAVDTADALSKMKSKTGAFYGAMAGPMNRLDTPDLTGKYTVDDILAADDYFDNIFPDSRAFDRTKARVAFLKMVEGDGALQPGEVKILAKAFGITNKELTAAMPAVASNAAKIRFALRMLSLPKFAGDTSFVGRQNAIPTMLGLYDGKTKGAFKQMWDVYKNSPKDVEAMRQAFDDATTEVLSHPAVVSGEFESAGGTLTGMRDFTGDGDYFSEVSLATDILERAADGDFGTGFMGRLPSGVKKLLSVGATQVEAGEKAQDVYSNHLRLGLWDEYSQILKDEGVPYIDPDTGDVNKQYKNAANLVMAMSGRSNFWQSLESNNQMKRWLYDGFLSPRFLYSQFESPVRSLATMINPKTPPKMRAKLAQQYAKVVLPVFTTIMSARMLYGEDADEAAPIDPTDPDFGTVRIPGLGGTRINLLAGFKGSTGLVTQAARFIYKSIADRPALRRDFGQTNAWDMIGNFSTNRTSIPASLVISVLKGIARSNEDPRFGSHAGHYLMDAMFPANAQDTIRAYQGEETPAQKWGAGAVTGVGQFFGVDVKPDRPRRRDRFGDLPTP